MTTAGKDTQIDLWELAHFLDKAIPVDEIIIDQCNFYTCGCCFHASNVIVQPIIFNT